MADLTKFVIFDCDGTLVDSQHAIAAGMEYAWQKEGLIAPSRQDLRRQVGLPLVEAISNLLPDGDIKQHHRMADNYRGSFSNPTVQILDDEPLFPHCIEILEKLYNDDIILGVATGKGGHGLKSTLKRHGIAKYFQNLKTADDGRGKPNPDILLDAMIEVGATANQSVMIGDTVFDIGAAVNAKIASIGVSWGYHETDELLSAGANIVIDDYQQLPDALNQIWKDC